MVTPLHAARQPDALLPMLGVLDPWTLAALLTPVALGAAIVAIRSRGRRKEEAAPELESLLKDFCEGR